MRQRGPNRWELRVRYKVPGGIRGGRRQISRTFRGTKREAREALAALVTSVQASVPDAATTEPRLGQLVEDYLASCTTRGRKPKTLYGYLQLWKIAAKDLADVRLSEVQTLEVDAYFRGLVAEGRGTATVNRLRAFLMAVGNWAVAKDVLSSHPFSGTDRMGHTTKTTRLATTPQIRSIYQQALESDLEAALAIRLGATLGSRRAEIHGHRWTDVDWDGAQIRRHSTISAVPKIEVGNISLPGTDGPVVEPTKAKTDEWHPIDTETVELLRRHHERCLERAREAGVTYLEEGFIFSSEIDGSRPITPDSLTKRVKKVAESVAGCEWIRPKHLRMWASSMVEQRFGMGTSANRLDHSGEVTARHYTGRDAERERLAANALADLLDSEGDD